MYSTIRTKKIIFQNKQSSPLLFCLFINDQRIILILKNSALAILHTRQCQQPRIVYEDYLKKNVKILDCKRIKQNVCAIITQTVEVISFVRYINDQEVHIGDIKINQMVFFRQLRVTRQLISFNEKQFVIKSQCFSNKITYFTIFKQDEQQQFNYQICSKIYQHENINSNTQILKALPLTSEFAFFKQKQIKEAEWKISLIKINKLKQDISLNVTEIFNENHLLLDIIAKSEYQYYLFVGKLQGNNQSRTMVYKCTLNQFNGKYAENYQLLNNFLVQNMHPIQILDINYNKKYFLMKTFAHIRLQDQIYDNNLQIRNLQNGELMEKIQCNLKTIDFSPNHTRFVDYSQQINTRDEIIIHLRVIIDKNLLYLFLLNNSPLFADPKIKKLHLSILQTF